MCTMKQSVYWCIVIFLTDFVSVNCRSPSVNNLFRNRASTTISPSTEEILHQQLLTTTEMSSSPDSTEENNNQQLLTLPISDSTPASIKVVPAIVAHDVKSTSSFDMALGSNLNSSKVSVLTADAIVDFSATPVVRMNKTDDQNRPKPKANITLAERKHEMNIRDRILLINVSRLTVTRPANASQMFPKRPLLSPTMSRYLAIAKEKALYNNSTPSSTYLLKNDKPTHVISKRHIAALLSLDDFVLDIDNM